MKPQPMECPQCGRVTDFVWDTKDNEWELDGEWWYDPLAAEPRTGYVCSHRCVVIRGAASSVV
jgi:hypothetical protein